ncbi:hypothetical protein A5784_03645 [Mycobacterium sp. 852013-50091_SCH5140682]|nr:hypothetical protein A5784_03645 [Mycobacterium sp. 852013-50091_SCH5140682]
MRLGHAWHYETPTQVEAWNLIANIIEAIHVADATDLIAFDPNCAVRNHLLVGADEDAPVGEQHRFWI